MQKECTERCHSDSDPEQSEGEESRSENYRTEWFFRVLRRNPKSPFEK
jgi:hypothetical protein